MYSEKSVPRPEAHVPKGPKPVFIRSEDIRNDDRKQATGEELYVALVKVIDGNNIAGIQQIRRLWRIYLNSHADRVKLISHGLALRGASVPVYDVNPFTKSRDENLTRVIIKDIPLSLSDEVIQSKLESMKYQVQGGIFRQKLRVNGQLTNCLNGDRVLYITPPAQPVPRKLLFGSSFMARIYHPGQPEYTGGGQVTCSRCLESGHHVSRCSNDVKCQVCKQTGHMRNECPENRQEIHANSAPAAPAARPPAPRGDDSRESTHTTQQGSRTRQTSLADFVPKFSKQPSQSIAVDHAEVMDLRSPMRTRSASRSHTTEAPSAYASDGAIDCSSTRSHSRNYRSVTRDEGTHDQQASDFDGEIGSGNTSSEDEESSLSPETPPKTVSGKAKSQKRKKKSVTRKK